MHERSKGRSGVRGELRASGENREFKLHVYGKRQIQVENFSK